MLLVLLVAIAVGIFGLGYYLGNQIGRTEHIRHQLNQGSSTSLMVSHEPANPPK